ncbi:MAG: imidazole glycerol phosphate synthase subunit HisH [Actinomycetota bacterium]|nr:imidazole glycerol phosphate synthase subunit HisH [Actinomycetota bacterium]
MIATMVDYGAGNLRSLRAAFERAGAEVAVTDQPEQVARGELVIIPGVGQAASAMEALRERGLVDAILAALRGGSHLFGVCVGMQLLFARSEEGDTAGLGLLPGSATRLAGARRLPHMGWNDVETAATHPLTAAFPAPCYFAHTYAVQDAAPRSLLASTTVERGGFASLVGEGRVAGAQFHPERSGAAGAEFLRSLVRWASDAA